MEDFQRKETPHEIIVDILSRLPVKSLMRFRCVCKQWLSLTYDKHFINMHMKRHTGCSIVSYGKIVERCPYELSFVILEKDGTTPIDKLKFEIDSQVNFVLPSCNGLICLDGLYVCNPGTREIVSLPPSTVSTSDYSYGFGFDPLAEQYKVVKFINNNWAFRFHHILGPITEVSYCEVLTVGDESWRNIGNFPFSLVGDPVFVQGFLHWMNGSFHNTDELIVSFDVGAEKFGVIPHPECLSLKKRHSASLLLLGGYLCILDRDFEDRKIKELWILEDYSARTWVKVRIVLPSKNKFHPRPVVAMINGEILLRTKDLRLISYNLQSKSFRKVGIEGQSRSSHHLRISSHVESLTPILRGAI